MEYRCILAALDLTEHDGRVLERARHMADREDAALAFVTAVKPVRLAHHGIAGGVATPRVDFDGPRVEQYRGQLAAIGHRWRVAEDDIFVRTGSPDRVIANVAREIGADLIVVGGHQHHGFERLRRSTAHGVVAASTSHRVTADTLVVEVD